MSSTSGDKLSFNTSDDNAPYLPSQTRQLLREYSNRLEEQVQQVVASSRRFKLLLDLCDELDAEIQALESAIGGVIAKIVDLNINEHDPRIITLLQRYDTIFQYFKRTKSRYQNGIYEFQKLYMVDKIKDSSKRLDDVEKDFGLSLNKLIQINSISEIQFDLQSIDQDIETVTTLCEDLKRNRHSIAAEKITTQEDSSGNTRRGNHENNDLASSKGESTDVSVTGKRDSRSPTHPVLAVSSGPPSRKMRLMDAAPIDDSESYRHNPHPSSPARALNTRGGISDVVEVEDIDSVDSDTNDFEEIKFPHRRVSQPTLETQSGKDGSSRMLRRRFVDPSLPSKQGSVAVPDDDEEAEWFSPNRKPSSSSRPSHPTSLSSIPAHSAAAAHGFFSIDS